MPDDATGLGVLLAHGAGAGQRHPFMSQLRSSLATAGFPTLSFDYPFMEAGRRAPDRMPQLLQAHVAAAERLTDYVDAVAFAGRSMGGRVGSHLVGDELWAAAGLVYFAYPLVPLKTGQPRPIGHLSRIRAPQLFWVGTRDRMSPVDLIVPLVARLPEADVRVVDAADHAFRASKRSGRSNDEIIMQLAQGTAAWLERLWDQIANSGR